MKDKKERALHLRIDFRNHRILIHRSTLRMIGDPAFIHLGVNPEKMTLIVLGTWIDERRAIRVRFTKSGSFYVSSKPLIEGIKSVVKSPDSSDSYLLSGKKIASIPAISFSLRDMEIENDGEHDADGTENE